MEDRSDSSGLMLFSELRLLVYGNGITVDIPISQLRAEEAVQLNVVRARGVIMTSPLTLQRHE